MRRLEISIEKAFCFWLKENWEYWECLKFEPPGSDGWPDRILIGPHGWVMWLEFKREGKDPEPLQVERIEWLRARGHYVGVVRSLEEAKESFRNYFHT